jgi:selenocysteine lyase/cysteine desulfurase
MGSPDDPGGLDYVAISAHKMYAPYGTGALIGRRDTFEQGIPDYSGGGTVEIVTLDEVAWADPPDRDEAGSPNTIGAVALAAAIRKLTDIGMNKVASHEVDLTRYALEKLAQHPNIQIIGDNGLGKAHERLGVIPFNLNNISHFLVASILGHEFGIGVRSGCFCAHPYVLHLLGLSQAEADRVRDQMIAGYKAEMPGLVRASFGLYNSFDEIDRMVNSLEKINAGGYTGKYVQDPASGEYHPKGWAPEFDRYLSF